MTRIHEAIPQRVGPAPCTLTSAYDFSQYLHTLQSHKSLVSSLLPRRWPAMDI